MKSKPIRVASLIILTLFGGAAFAQAQESVTPEKRELIKELLEVTGGAKSIDTMMEAMGRQQEQDLPRLMAQAATRERNLTPAERAELERKLKESTVRVNKRMREAFQRINYQQMLADIAASIFGKYFTESELRDWIAFYKSPVGKKSIELMPQMMTEMMAQMSKTLFPKIQDEMDQIIADEAKQLEKESKPVPSPQPSPRTGRRRRP